MEFNRLKMSRRVSKLSSGFFRQSHAPDVEIESDEEPDRPSKDAMEVEEAPAEKKLQQAKEYIQSIRAQMNEDADIDGQILMDKIRVLFLIKFISLTVSVRQF